MPTKADDGAVNSSGIQGLRKKIEAVVRPHVDGPVYALLDFPDHCNPGDCAIWLGERRMLDHVAGRAPAWVASMHSYDARGLRALPQSAPIFLHGGGNVGDLWPPLQAFRERVLADAVDRRVVILTQSIQFRAGAALERARRAFNGHPNLTLLVRDASSFEFARSHFECASELCPDFALALDLQRPAGDPKNDVFCLMRTDHESAGIAQQLERGLRRADWPDPYLLSRAWLHRVSRLPRGAQVRLADFLARWRLANGLQLFAGASRVITDRLHGHVLCTLMGIPNVLLPEAHGKNRGLYDAWTRNLPGCTFAETPEQALAELDGLARA